MTDAPQAPVSKPGFRWARLVLILSLALNLIVVGLIVGAFIGFGDKRGGGAPPRVMDRMSMGLGAQISALPEAARNRVAEAGGGFTRENRREKFARLRQSQNAIIEAMSAEPFDENALRAALDAHRETAFGSTIALHDRFVQEFSALSQEERKSVLKEAETMRRKWRDRKRKKREGKD